MRKMKTGLALLLALAMTWSLAACGGAPAPRETASFSVAAIKGPSSMGLVKLMRDAEAGEGTGNDYAFTLAASADEVTPLLIKGELDMAYLPPNLAAVLHQKTGGEIVALAVNSLGILYIVENGNAVRSLADLAGKTVAAAGKGSVPEYALGYLLAENGLEMGTDVIVDWRSEHSECVAALASGAATVALLPQPFVTVAQGKLPDLRTALDLTAEWDALGSGSTLITGVVVARRAVVEENPAAVDAFLQDYAASAAWVNEHVSDAAALIGEYGIVEAAVAEKALPYCNIVCITGEEMRGKLEGYLQVLYDAAPDSVGGALPGDAFYYGA